MSDLIKRLFRSVSAAVVEKTISTTALKYTLSKIKDKFALKSEAVKNIAANGRSITVTKADGTSSTFQTQDTVYTHPSNSSSYTSGLYKITIDKYGHVISAVAVQKADITNLGIPGSVITSASEIKLASGKTVETAINEILSVLEKAVFYDDSVG